MYFDDGETVQLKMTYDMGDRVGTSLKYYKTGELYAETPYVADIIHGDRKIYFRNGNLKAVIPYGNGLVGTGLREFFRSGKEKELPIITYQRQSDKLILTTSEQCRETQFYIGELIDGRYFPENGIGLDPIHKQDFEFTVDLNEYSPSYLALQDVICDCKTSQGNKLIIRKRIRL